MKKNQEPEPHHCQLTPSHERSSSSNMSDSSKDDHRGQASSSRMWVESRAAPSRFLPSSRRQGYCSYCRTLYTDLDQHLSSLQHLDAVRASSRGSAPATSSKLTLLERFLQDVQLHHPHNYNDPRPSHADLPAVSTLPSPRVELDNLLHSDNSALGTREHLSSPDVASCELANQQEDPLWTSTPIREHELRRPPTAEHTHVPQSQPPHTKAAHKEAPPPHTSIQTQQAPTPQVPCARAQPPHAQTPPPVHRKAHRKTNRRKTSESSSSEPKVKPHLSAEARPCSFPEVRPRRSPEVRPHTSVARPWLSWQKERREAQREEAFSSDQSDALDESIEQVIQMCCHGSQSPTKQEDEMDSFHLSLAISMDTQSDDWDSPAQVCPPAVPLSQKVEKDLGHLMDTQVQLDDQMYSQQLDSTLLRGEGGASEDQGYWTLPVEQVFPVPEHIPASFKGKSWAQIEQEDEERVEKLVQQFRRGRFICYFDTESLAREGRSHHKKQGSQEEAAPEEVEEAEPDDVLPLMECEEEEELANMRRRTRPRRFRLASRCQVVKVSRSTQTATMVVPSVRQAEAPPTSVPAASRDAAGQTPDVQTWLRLPASYSSIITPLQPRTALVYLLCPSSGRAPQSTPSPGSALRRCKRKRRPLDHKELKVKYQRVPFKFYDPGSNRILKNAPRRRLWRRHRRRCVRQLFRSLSPDLNSDQSRVKGQQPTGSTPAHNNGFLLSTHSGDSHPDGAPSPSPHSPTESGGVRSHSQTPQRRGRALATPSQPHRLRQAGRPHLPFSRRGRLYRGRGFVRGRGFDRGWS